MGDKRDKTLSELAFTIADHQARIEKLGMKWAAILTDRLDASEKALMAEITSYMEKHTRGLNSLSSLTALHRLEKKIAAIRKEAFTHAQQEIMPEAGELADNEQKWAGKITGILAPESADKLSLVNKKALNDGLGKQLIESRTAEEWFSGTASADVMRINDMVREGVRSGWTIQEMTRRIVGTKANNYTDGLLETSRSHATTMARTLCCGVANNAKDQFYQENDDVVIGVEWLDTLDSRTCSRCGGLSRKRWKTKEPHPVPPAHHNCRCVLIPVTELTDLGDDAFRPAANADFDAEAKELYETKYPGKKFEDIAPSTRKKYFYEAQKAYTARTGNPPYRQVPGGMTFSEYFEQMTEKEKERYLGPGRYEVWKNGNLPLTKFFPPYPERTYTVKELKEMDKKSLFNGVSWLKFPKKSNVSEPSFEIKGMRGIAEQMRKILGTESVNLSGITDEGIANRMNKALYEIKKKYPDFFLSGVRTDKTLNRNEPVATNWFNELLLNPDYINNLLTTYQKHPVVDGKYVLPGTGAMYHGKEIETLIYHEAGHSLYNIKIGNGDMTKKGNSGATSRRHKLAVLKQMYLRAKKEGYAANISDYATINEKEFFSEVIAAENLDKKGIPDYIKSGIKEVLK